MIDTVADTHAILWYFFETAKLSEPANAALMEAAAANRLYIATITLVEVTYLNGKKDFPYPTALPRLYSLLEDPTEPLWALPLTVDVARALAAVPRSEVPDMPDRIISATAVAHNYRLVSADADIRGSATLNSMIQVIW